MRDVSRAAAKLPDAEDERATFLLRFLSGLGP